MDEINRKTDQADEKGGLIAWTPGSVEWGKGETQSNYQNINAYGPSQYQLIKLLNSQLSLTIKLG